MVLVCGGELWMAPLVTADSCRLLLWEYLFDHNILFLTVSGIPTLVYDFKLVWLQIGVGVCKISYQGRVRESKIYSVAFRLRTFISLYNDSN